MLAALAVTACAATLTAGVAEAATYTASSCNQSATRSMANWTHTQTSGSSGGVDYFSESRNCVTFGIYRRFGVNGTAAGATAVYTFAAPADTWISKAYVAQAATPRSTGAYDAIYAELDDSTQRTVASAVGNAQSTLNDATYTLPATGAHAVRLRAEMGCQAGANCAGIWNNEYGNEWYIGGTVMYLEDEFVPAVGTVGGSGWQSTPADTVTTVNYSASDKGSGLSEVRFYVDGIQYAVNQSNCTAGIPLPCPLSATGSFVLDITRLAEGDHAVAVVAKDYSGNTMLLTDKQQTITVRRPPQPSESSPVSTTNPSWNGGGSPAVGDHLTGNAGGWSGNAVTYTYQWMRCDADGLNCLPIDGATALTYTPSPADVGHALVFCVTAANSGGSSTSCSTPTAPVVASHPPTGGGTTTTTADPVERPGEPVSSGASTPPANNAVADRGSPNGSPASDRVVLTALANNRSSTIKSKFGKRVPISGKLLGPTGAPISNAILEVQTRTAIPGAAVAAAGKVVTGADGRFTYIAPAGPSRVVRIAYRSHSGDSSLADTSDVTLLVKAGVTIKATPKRVHNRHATVFTGRLLGKPINKRGVVVDLQVFFRHKWRTFGAPRTNRAGKYRFKYRFMAGAATWKFRARVRRESSYPYIEGYSLKTVKVKVVP
ncbi:MAG TPA: hypothetical protein VFN64_02400 [Burkholderiaceae bacterium]|nr:hypothetical protein [Burkholderiaceae bacterium]